MLIRVYIKTEAPSSSRSQGPVGSKSITYSRCSAVTEPSVLACPSSWRPFSVWYLSSQIPLCLQREQAYQIIPHLLLTNRVTFFLHHEHFCDTSHVPFLARTGAIVMKMRTTERSVVFGHTLSLDHASHQVAARLI